MERNTRDIKATRTRGSGELPALLKTTESAMPVVATAQLVVASRRVRQILLRYISPLYRCASMPSSAALNGFSCLGFSVALISLPGLTLKREGQKGKKSSSSKSSLKKHGRGCQCVLASWILNAAIHLHLVAPENAAPKPLKTLPTLNCRLKPLMVCQTGGAHRVHGAELPAGSSHRRCEGDMAPGSDDGNK